MTKCHTAGLASLFQYHNCLQQVDQDNAHQLYVQEELQSTPNMLQRLQLLDATTRAKKELHIHQQVCAIQHCQYSTFRSHRAATLVTN